jgi:hypothetical protein
MPENDLDCDRLRQFTDQSTARQLARTGAAAWRESGRVQCLPACHGGYGIGQRQRLSPPQEYKPAFAVLLVQRRSSPRRGPTPQFLALDEQVFDGAQAGWVERRDPVADDNRFSA